MFYVIRNGQVQCADYQFEDDCKEYKPLTMDEYFLHPNKVIIVDGELQENPDYEHEEEEKEKERISHLTCTKRVLVLILEQLGLDYFQQIEPLINSNRQAKLEWELCVELERSNPLLNVVGQELGISPEQIDQIFKYANGEVDTLTIKGE